MSNLDNSFSGISTTSKLVVKPNGILWILEIKFLSDASLLKKI